MKALCCSAQFVALCLLAACGTTELFGEYELPESEDVASAPYPRLADTPIPPPPGTYGPGFPDPAAGKATVEELSAAAGAAALRARALEAPVLSEADRRRLGRN